MAAKKEGYAVAAEEILVPLKDILLTFPNSRTGDFTKGETLDKSNGQSFTDLVESIKVKGQEQAGLGRWKGKKVELISGWRRYMAIKTIAAASGEKNPVMKLVMKDLDDTAALEANLIENTREGLSGPDLGYSLWQLSEQKKAKGEKLSDRQIAAIVGRHHSYVSDLLAIFRNAPKVAKKWHAAKVQLSVGNMQRIAKIEDKGEQMAEYDRLLEELKNEPDGANRGKPWIKTAVQQGERIAGILGTLEKRGCITVMSELDWAAELEFLGVRVKKDAQKRDRKKIGDAMAAAFDEAKNAPDAKDPEASEDETIEEAAE